MEDLNIDGSDKLLKTVDEGSKRTQRVIASGKDVLDKNLSELSKELGINSLEMGDKGIDKLNENEKEEERE